MTDRDVPHLIDFTDDHGNGVVHHVLGGPPTRNTPDMPGRRPPPRQHRRSISPRTRLPPPKRLETLPM